MSGSEPVWSYVPLDDVAVPVVPASSESVRTGLVSAWRRMFGESEQDDAGSCEFEQLAERRATELVPDPGWGEAVFALRDLLAAAEEGPPVDATTTVIVGPPGGGVAEILTQWAEREGADLLAPSSPGLPSAGVADLERSDGPSLVIPALDCFYRRSAVGLAHVREVLHAVRRSRRRVWLGCDSWAWAYLGKAVQADAILPEAYAPAPLTGAGLAAWIGAICSGLRVETFRFVNDDSPVFPDQHASQESASEAQHEFFDLLAGTSRGNPEVALALFRSSLRSASRPRGRADGLDERGSGAAGRSIVWLEDSFGHLPVVPAETSRVDAIVMHTLLLHVELPEAELRELVPFDSASSTRSLVTLQGHELLEEREGVWSVRRVAHPAVRSFLAGEGFLVDGF